jgi:hypothetical protein
LSAIREMAALRIVAFSRSNRLTLPISLDRAMGNAGPKRSAARRRTSCSCSWFTGENTPETARASIPWPASSWRAERISASSGWLSGAPLYS